METIEIWRGQPTTDTDGNTIHIRGSQPSGIQATDLIKVRGILLPVKGKPQVWNNLHGRHIGDVITVGEREG